MSIDWKNPELKTEIVHDRPLVWSDQKTVAAKLETQKNLSKYRSLIIEHEDDIWEHAIYTINKRYIDNELNNKTDQDFEEVFARLDSDLSIQEIIYAIKSRLKQNVEILMIDSKKIMLRNIVDNRMWSENIKRMKQDDILNKDNDPADDVRWRRR